MGVSKNRGTPKSWILIVLSIGFNINWFYLFFLLCPIYTPKTNMDTQNDGPWKRWLLWKNMAIFGYLCIYVKFFGVYPPWNWHSTWKWMVGILVSYWVSAYLQGQNVSFSEGCLFLITGMIQEGVGISLTLAGLLCGFQPLRIALLLGIKGVDSPCFVAAGHSAIDTVDCFGNAPQKKR